MIHDMFANPVQNTYYTLKNVLLFFFLFRKPLLLHSCNGLKITVIQDLCFRFLVYTHVLMILR